MTLLSILVVAALAVSLYNTWQIMNIAVVLMDNNLIPMTEEDEDLEDE